MNLEKFTDRAKGFLQSAQTSVFGMTTLAGVGLEAPEQFVQDNHSCSAAGVLRGLHYQRAPYTQGKLVRVVRGSAWDVAVDIRPGSPTYGRWACAEISAGNRRTTVSAVTLMISPASAGARPTGSASG